MRRLQQNVQKSNQKRESQSVTFPQKQNCATDRSAIPFLSIELFLSKNDKDHGKMCARSKAKNARMKSISFYELYGVKNFCALLGGRT